MERHELARSLYRALAGGDREALGRLLHPEFTGVTTEGLPLGLGGSYEGPRAMRREFWGQIARHFDVRAEPTGFSALDDGRLLVVGRYRGKSLDAGHSLDAAFQHLLTFDGDTIARLEQLTDSALWTDALAGPIPATAGAPAGPIGYGVEDGLARITLNRPGVRNAIDLRLAEETLTVARRCADDPSIRAVLITGAGPAFTVGGDIGYLAGTQEDLAPLLRKMTTPFHEAFRIFSRLDVPIVTAVHGAVAGGGLGFVYAADIVLAAEDTRFVTAFGALGLSGDGGGTWHLPRLIGPRRAAQLYLENTPLDAERAAEWGLITEVVPAADLQARAITKAKHLANGPTRAYAHMRRLLRESWNTGLAEQLSAETEALTATAATADAQEGLAAFTQKRRPVFEGR